MIARLAALLVCLAFGAAVLLLALAGVGAVANSEFAKLILGAT